MATKWITGDSINTRKTVEKRKVTGRNTNKMIADYRKGKKSGRGFKR